MSAAPKPPVPGDVLLDATEAAALASELRPGLKVVTPAAFRRYVDAPTVANPAPPKVYVAPRKPRWWRSQVIDWALARPGSGYRVLPVYPGLWDTRQAAANLGMTVGALEHALAFAAVSNPPPPPLTEEEMAAAGIASTQWWRKFFRCEQMLAWRGPGRDSGGRPAVS